MGWAHRDGVGFTEMEGALTEMGWAHQDSCGLTEMGWAHRDRGGLTGIVVDS